MIRRYDAVLFDLLTALVDSWSLWNRVAGNAEDGKRWRLAYLRRTYGAGVYRPYLNWSRKRPRRRVWRDPRPTSSRPVMRRWSRGRKRPPF
jgi:hypothetical protein